MTGIFETRQRRKSKESAQRSDTARQRRAKRQEEQHKKVQFVSEHPRSLRQPPVVARGRATGMATPMRGANRSRRRFDIAINAIPGAEFRIPSVPAAMFGWRLASGVMVMLMLACLYLLGFTPFFQVERVQVEGLERLNPADITLVVGISGDPLVSLNPKTIQNNLYEAFPDLEDVRVSLVLPDTVKINIVERTPVLRWVNDSGEHWVDQKGYIFPPRGDGSSLPLVQADILPGVTEDMLARIAGGKLLVPEETTSKPEMRLDEGLVKTMSGMLANIPVGTPLIFQEEHGFGWRDGHGWDVYFGSQSDNMDQKQVVYQAIADYLVSNGIQPALVSVEFVHAPYYRMER